MNIAYRTVRDEDPRPWLEIRRTLQLRQQRRRSRAFLELIGIAFILLMSMPTAWWVGSESSVRLSGVTTTLVALVPPREQLQHRIVGHTSGYSNLAGNASQPGVQDQQYPTGI